MGRFKGWYAIAGTLVHQKLEASKRVSNLTIQICFGIMHLREGWTKAEVWTAISHRFDKRQLRRFKREVFKGECY